MNLDPVYQVSLEPRTPGLRKPLESIVRIAMCCMSSSSDGVDCIVLELISYGTLWRHETQDNIVMSSAYYFNSNLQILSLI